MILFSDTLEMTHTRTINKAVRDPNSSFQVRDKFESADNVISTTTYSKASNVINMTVIVAIEPSLEDVVPDI